MGRPLIQPFGETLVAGDRWKWTVSLGDYPADTWRLMYAFRGASKIDLVSTAFGIEHLLDALPVETGKLEPGTYAWQAVVEKITDATQHYELARGMVEIQYNIEKAGAGSSPTDLLSQNQSTRGTSARSKMVHVRFRKPS